MKFFVLTGPECSGKTTLSEQLSQLYNLPLVDEYARTYIDSLNQHYNESDLHYIAHHQIETEKKYLDKDTIFDTDLLTTYIWMEEVYQHCRLDWLEQLSGNTHKIYLLCKPYSNWVYDPQRENPMDRDRLYEKHIHYLQLLNLDFIKIGGDDSERLRQARNVIDNYLGQ